MKVGTGNGSVASLADLTRTFAKIGLLSFGGPAGQIALMHRIVVVEKGWISEQRFLHALNFCMLLPGPEAQQLATYVGWMLHRLRGGLIAGSLFIIPGFVVILALSYLYVGAGSLAVVQGLFAGLKAAVIVIVVEAVIRIARKALKTPLLRTVAAAAFVAMFVFQVPFPFVIMGAAAIGLAVTRTGTQTLPGRATDPVSSARRNVRYVAVFLAAWLTPTLVLTATVGPDNVFAHLARFFSTMAVVTFGGAYAVLAWVAQEAVQAQAWLDAGQMIDGLALAETTPGPLILVVQFVGFMAAWQSPGALPPGLAALLASVLTVWVTFVPCFLWIFLGAPYMERLRQNARLSGALSAVTAAVVGVIANLALWFAFHALFAEVSVRGPGGIALPSVESLRWPLLIIAAVCAVMAFRLRASVLVILATASVLGVASVLL